MNKAKIMIVDDEKNMVDTLTEFLLASGYNVVSAFCGAEALTMAEMEKPDLILLDIGMPGLDGFKTGRRFKDGYITKDTPIIMLTAHTTHEDYLRAVKEVGAVDFVPKPFRFQFLLKKIERVLAIYSHKKNDSGKKTKG
jgi:DNA-binding response OmpR family regulator